MPAPRIHPLNPHIEIVPSALVINNQILFSPLALCTDGSVRLVIGETADFFYLQGAPLADSYYDNDVLRAGRVEVCFRGTYVTICDTAWDNIAASVVCRQLGFSPYGAVGVRNNFPQSTLMATLQNVNCTGSESNLLQCGYTAGPAGTCGGFQDAEAVCQGQVFWIVFSTMPQLVDLNSLSPPFPTHSPILPLPHSLLLPPNLFHTPPSLTFSIFPLSQIAQWWQGTVRLAP